MSNQFTRYFLFLELVAAATFPSTFGRIFCDRLMTLADLDNYPRRVEFIQAAFAGDPAALAAECWHLSQYPGIDADWIQFSCADAEIECEELGIDSPEENEGASHG